MAPKDQPNNETCAHVTLGALSASRKIYKDGVPMREIALEGGETFTVYDTSGPYTDENAEIHIERGLKKIREKWVKGRSGNVSQMHYARKGEITEEMEFVARRERLFRPISATRSWSR